MVALTLVGYPNLYLLLQLRLLYMTKYIGSNAKKIPLPTCANSVSHHLWTDLQSPVWLCCGDCSLIVLNISCNSLIMISHQLFSYFRWKDCDWLREECSSPDWLFLVSGAPLCPPWRFSVFPETDWREWLPVEVSKKSSSFCVPVRLK